MSYEQTPYEKAALRAAEYWDRRKADSHDYLYPELAAILGFSDGESEIKTSSEIAQRIIRFDQYARTSDTDSCKKIGAKGISATLLRVVQHGKWKLDDIDFERPVRELVYSPALEEAGYRFQDTYEKPESAKRRYTPTIVPVDERGNDVLLVSRNRALADVSNPNDAVIHLVRRSVFAIKHAQLSKEGAALDSKVRKKLRQNGEIDDEMRDDLGNYIIEPALRDRAGKELRRSVLPATSTIYALIRSEEP